MSFRRQQLLVHQRSGGQCEAMVQVEDSGAWTRCWKTPVETHHMLTRARGGDLLDARNEIYHLIDLCPRCHRWSDGQQAYEAGLLIDGYMTLDSATGRAYYVGSDQYLQAAYPRPVLPSQRGREIV